MKHVPWKPTEKDLENKKNQQKSIKDFFAEAEETTKEINEVIIDFLNYISNNNINSDIIIDYHMCVRVSAGVRDNDFIKVEKDSTKDVDMEKNPYEFKYIEGSGPISEKADIFKTFLLTAAPKFIESSEKIDSNTD